MFDFSLSTVNGVKITKMDHDSAVDFLSSSGPTVTLKLKYYPTAKPYLSPTQQSKSWPSIQPGRISLVRSKEQGFFQIS